MPTFRAQAVAGQSTFHVGERIPLELSFSSTVKDRFELNMASYDRSGRMSHEQFEVSPKSGWSDPLARYFQTAGGFGGGLSGIGVLTSTPSIIAVDLNEWVRFDQPGTYRVTVSSSRVIDVTRKRIFGGDPPPHLQAEAFVLRIIPATPQWQAARLQAALAQLHGVPATLGQQPPEREAAIADLRFLGTKEALHELAANVRDDHADVMYPSAFGLIGVSALMHDAALQSLEQRLDDPAFPVCGWFLEVMSRLNEDGAPSFQAYVRSKEEVWRKVLAALPRKQGKERAATVQTLLSSPPADLDAEKRRELAGVLAASFQDLPEEQRASQLMWQWDALRSTSVLPALQASARLALAHPGSMQSTLSTRRELKSAALARWYAMDPEGATQEIMAQIGSATPSLTAKSLAFLPMQTLPQFEALWAQRLTETEDSEEAGVLAGLLVRFGTGAATSQMASKVRAKVADWPCEPQAAALAYLVKFDPEEAKPLLQQAMDTRAPGKTGCSLSFQNVSAHASAPVLTDAAVSSLDEPDSRVLMDALIYLAAYGRKEDQKPIWDRYVKWSEQWAGKAEVLDSEDRTTLERSYIAIGVGENLAHALIANQGWLADADLTARVLKMCVGEQVCRQIEQVAALAAAPHHVSLNRNAYSENYEVGQYSAKSLELLGQKISQYPKGTIFHLNSSTPQNEDQRELAKEAEAIFKAHGMSLQATPN